jgi:hypothetical protein
MRNTQYFERLWNSFRAILKEPVNVGKQFVESKDYLLGIGFIVAEVLCSGLYFFLFGFRLNLGVIKAFKYLSALSAKHLSLLSYFGFGLLSYAIDAGLLLLIMFLFSKLFSNPKVDIQNAVILISLQAIFDIPVTLAAGCVSFLSSAAGLFVYSAGKLLGLLIVSKLYPYEDSNGSEKSSYIVFSIYGAAALAKGIVDMLYISMMLK